MKSQQFETHDLVGRFERTARKRTRSSRSQSVCSSAMIALMVASMNALMHTAKGFHSPRHRPRPWLVEAVGSPLSDTLQPMQPKSTTSRRKREEAIKAMNRDKVESALDGVDAQMLEMLSDQFLFPLDRSAKPTSRPIGRPDFVPGAMKFETLIKYREGKEREAIANQQPQPVKKAQVVSTRGRKKQLRVKGSSPSIEGKELSDLNLEKSELKKKKRIVKNLPERKCTTKATSKRRSVRKGRSKVNNLEVQKYYKTELLTAEEEYALGIKIQLLSLCEHVHEGLALQYMRLPTIEEWAGACGYHERDSKASPTSKMVEHIRPAGSESMFEVVNPNTFVGNGLAHSAGPGRGRGRVKKPPPTFVKDFYDSKETNFDRQSKSKTPMNRGTVSDFVSMMIEGKEAKQRMVQSNMRLVVSIARKYSNVGVSLQDLVQEGSLGLSRAAEKFDPSKGFKFSTYASWWIQQAVFRSIAYHSRTIRLPVHVHNLLNRVRKVRSELERGLGRQPTNEEMAESLDMSLAKYNKMLRLTRRSISLELPKYQSNPKDLGHESEDLIGDTISNGPSQEDEATPEKRVDNGLFYDDLHEMLRILDEDERNVIRYRYGLADGLTRTVTAVAAQMKQSKAWVRSQECKALRKLRRPWYEKKLKEHQEALSC
eukprot:scaffold9439_cov115-Cylindrotheca_fusiformis.AAC.5